MSVAIHATRGISSGGRSHAAGRATAAQCLEWLSAFADRAGATNLHGRRSASGCGDDDS